MTMGVGLVLVAVGAILTFAVHATFTAFSLSTIGVILMIVGGLGVILDLAVFMPRRRSVVTTTSQGGVDPYAGGVGRTVTQERQTF